MHPAAVIDRLMRDLELANEHQAVVVGLEHAVVTGGERPTADFADLCWQALIPVIGGDVDLIREWRRMAPRVADPVSEKKAHIDSRDPGEVLDPGEALRLHAILAGLAANDGDQDARHS